MTRRLAHLTLDNLQDLPTPCRDCVFWELDPVRRERVGADGACEKQAWVSQVLLEWGSCGRIAYVDDEAVGYVLHAPAAYVPGAAGFPTAPVSPDAVLLVTAYVAPEHAGGGLGRMLVQAVAKDVIEHGGSARAIEAFGDTRGRRGHCVLPADFLLRVGFRTHRPHALHPRLRLETRSLVTWKDEVEQAVERLLGVVRPRPAPSPDRRQVSRPAPGAPPSAR